MRVDLGSNVFSSDGENVGSVERIVLDSSTKEISKLVVRSGFLTHHDRLVDITMVTGESDDGGLRLDLTADQVNQLPEYVKDQYVQAPDNDVRDLPFIVPNALGGGAYLYGTPTTGRGYGDSGSLFDAAPANAPVLENRSNLRDVDVVIGEGTDVVGADGEKIGTVGEVFFDNDGKINGFIVKAGFIFKNDVRVPIDWVDEAGGDRITLNVNSAEAETQTYDVEDSTL